MTKCVGHQPAIWFTDQGEYLGEKCELCKKVLNKGRPSMEAVESLLKLVVKLYESAAGNFGGDKIKDWRDRRTDGSAEGDLKIVDQDGTELKAMPGLAQEFDPNSIRKMGQKYKSPKDMPTISSDQIFQVYHSLKDGSFFKKLRIDPNERPGK